MIEPRVTIISGSFKSKSIPSIKDSTIKALSQYGFMMFLDFNNNKCSIRILKL